MDNYKRLINVKILCDLVGIDDSAFQIFWESDSCAAGKMASPYILTHMAGARQITPETCYREDMMLYELEMLFTDQIREMQLELNAIRNYRSKNFGPKTKRGGQSPD